MKTSKKHFTVFKKECLKWIVLFGLLDWKFSFFHEQWDNEALANYKTNLEGKCAAINLSIDWADEPITNAQIKRSAFHEVCEVMLSRLAICVRSRFVSSDEIIEAIHDIIRRLENHTFGIEG